MTNFFTAQELATTYNISISTLKRNFKRTQEALKEKYGISLEKQGRGDSTLYYIQNFDFVDTGRAVTLYKSVEKNLIPVQTAAGLLDLHFLIFIAIVSSPNRCFRGSYVDLLDYIEVKINAENVRLAQQILRSLAEKDYIMYTEDKTDNMYFMAAILRRAERQMELEIDAVLQFQRITNGTRKSWIPLMKTYIALNFLQ